MARYGIVAPKVFGVSVNALHRIAKRTGRDHRLALALWDSGWYEARMLAAFVAEPDALTPAQMDRWAAAFDNWAICDTHCMHLFDRTPHAWSKVAQWTRRREEFVRRAGFALLASLALHDKQSPDGRFVRALGTIARGASDDRNFVKKGVSWALRSIGHRNRGLHARAVAVAQRLARAQGAARWVGKDALRDLTRPAVISRVERRSTSR